MTGQWPRKSPRAEDVERHDWSGKVLRFCAAYITEHGWAPSIREITAGVDLYSTSAAHIHLRRLEARGLVQRGARNESRALRLTDAGWAQARQQREAS